MVDISMEMGLVGLAAVVGLGIPIWKKYKTAILNKIGKKVDELEDVIEDKTGIDLEISDAVDNVLDKVVENLI